MTRWRWLKEPHGVIHQQNNQPLNFNDNLGALSNTSANRQQIVCVLLEWQVRVKWPVGTDGAGLEGALINFSCAWHSSPPRGDSGKVTDTHVYTLRPSTCLCAALTHRTNAGQSRSALSEWFLLVHLTLVFDRGPLTILWRKSRELSPAVTERASYRPLMSSPHSLWPHSQPSWTFLCTKNIWGCQQPTICHL